MFDLLVDTRSKELKDRMDENKRRYLLLPNVLSDFFKKLKKNTMEVLSKEQTALTEKSKIISQDSDVAQSLNYSFSSIVTNHRIPEYTENNSKSESITDSIIRIILNYRNHPSILNIGEVCKKDL